MRGIIQHELMEEGGSSMKKTSFGLALAVIFLYAHVASAQEDIAKYSSCHHCGMDRQHFAHSRMLVEYTDGTAVPLCSIHCLAIDLAQNSDKTPKDIMVADYNSKELIKAREAHWIMGGEKKGVMTKLAKWAFKKAEDAEDFIATNGGEMADFEKALKAAKDELTGSIPVSNKTPIKPTEKDKCPVCGMFVAQYPDFLAVIQFKDGSYTFFDGIKDMFRFYFNPEKYKPEKTLSDIDSIFVTAYYDLTQIDGRKAYYVSGSDILGPMGKELIPLKTEAEAKTFLKDHKGKEILKFDAVTEEMIKKLE